MRPGLLLLLGLSACPPPPLGETCQRVLVDPSGNANAFAGGPGGSSGSDVEPPLGSLGVPVSVTLFAPLSSCVSDTLRADATGVDPFDAPLAFALEAPVRSGAEGAVKVTLSFTPTTPGLHVLRVAFEPSLGVRTVLVEVVGDGLAGATTRVPVPAAADCKPTAFWPLTDDTVACETRSGSVSIHSAAGGTASFSGEQLVVVDTVLWSTRGATNTLERHVFEDGGVRLTDSFPNFPSLPTSGMHDVDLALRYRAPGQLSLVRLGSPILDFPYEGQPPDVGPPTYFADGELLFGWSFGCSGCVSLYDVVALEPGVVWRAPMGLGVPIGAALSGYDRPTTQTASTPRFRLQYRAEAPVLPGGPFERVPLWLNAALGTRRVLVSVENGGLTFSAWPRGEVLRVGRRHVLLSGPESGFVRVVRR